MCRGFVLVFQQTAICNYPNPGWNYSWPGAGCPGNHVGLRALLEQFGIEYYAFTGHSEAQQLIGKERRIGPPAKCLAYPSCGQTLLVQGYPGRQTDVPDLLIEERRQGAAESCQEPYTLWAGYRDGANIRALKVNGPVQCSDGLVRSEW